MSRFLLLYGAPATAAAPIDPETLSPSEHYRDVNWRSDLEWIDNGGSGLIFDTRSGTKTEAFKNSKKFYHSVAGYVRTGAANRAMSSWVNTDAAITMYVVMRWDGTDAQTLFYFSGTLTNQLFRMKGNGTGGLYMQIQDQDGDDLILNPAFTLVNGWHVFAVSLANVTGAGAVSVIEGQNDPVSTTQASWTKIDMSGIQSNNTLWNNNGNTEPWDGGWAELILYRGAHDTDTIHRVNQWLADKYDI